MLEPQLAPPGKGLPFFQQFVLRYWIFPRICKRMSWDEAQGLHDHVGKRILELAKPLSVEQFHTRILVSGIRGIEDSSRYWSVSMTIEHLIIVGTQIMEGMVAISQGGRPSKKADIAAVKPKGAYPDKSVIVKYEEFLRTYKQKVGVELKDKQKPDTMFHPWFGQLTMHKWHCLAAAHSQIHRRQIDAILKGLPQQQP